MVTKAADVTMATASSVQREPSMEEILASIRRIIEDSDPGRKPSGEPAGPAQALEPEAAESPEAEVEAFRSELRGTPETAKPFTLAEVQAQLAAEGAAADAAMAEAPVTLAGIGAQVAAASNDRGEAPAGLADHANDVLASDWPRDGAEKPSLAAEARREPHFDVQPDIGLSEDELGAGEEARHAPSRAGGEPVREDAEPGAKLALVSERTGRQVAAAFEELSEAFASRGRKSVDDMAEEMLRPMLQDWLDNNLPTLVERLVREEIERVARGA